VELLLLLLLLVALVGVTCGSDWRWRTSYMVMVRLAVVAADGHRWGVIHLRLLKQKRN